MYKIFNTNDSRSVIKETVEFRKRNFAGKSKRGDDKKRQKTGTKRKGEREMTIRE